MSISRQDVAKVALLARLQLTDDELVRMTEELGQIDRHATDGDIDLWRVSSALGEGDVA